jgi:hypothetical protein
MFLPAPAARPGPGRSRRRRDCPRTAGPKRLRRPPVTPFTLCSNAGGHAVLHTRRDARCLARRFGRPPFQGEEADVGDFREFGCYGVAAGSPWLQPASRSSATPSCLSAAGPAEPRYAQACGSSTRCAWVFGESGRRYRVGGAENPAGAEGSEEFGAARAVAAEAATLAWAD